MKTHAVVDRVDKGGAPLSNDVQVLFLVLQHLHEQGFTETARRLEQESGLVTKYLQDLVRCGAWDDAERYLIRLTGGWEDACNSKIFIAISRQRCREAIARRIDLNELPPLYQEAEEMVGSLQNSRQDESMDIASARDAVCLEIEQLIEANPLFQDMLDFPSIEASRLQTLMYQSLCWQHSLCKKPKQSVTLFNDHSCDSCSNGARSQTKAEKRGASRTPNVEPRTKDGSEKINTWKLAVISDSGHLQALCMPDEARNPSKVVGLLYTSEGNILLALGSNAVFKLWKLQYSDINPNIKLWQPATETVMKNDTSNSNPEDATACIALSSHDGVMSASGGKVSFFCMNTFKVKSIFVAPLAPPAATSIAFHPRDNTIVAFGMDDSTIQIYKFNAYQVKVKLRGHHKMITGLAFPKAMDVLVSSGADAQICFWNSRDWKIMRSIYIQPPENWSGTLVGDTRVEFHSYNTRCLVVHESQLALYDSHQECKCLWSPRDTLPAPISSAVYSCDGLLVYAGFRDGAVGIFEAHSLSLRCRIAPSAYVPPSISGAGPPIYPMVVAAHPSKPNQIALGLSDGTVHVLEP